MLKRFEEYLFQDNLNDIPSILVEEINSILKKKIKF